MIKNYLKIAWRNLLKNKVYSCINITGLATGMAVALLAGLWIWDELSFNANHDNQAQLAQVMLTQTSQGESYTGETIAMPLGDALRTSHAGDFKYVSLVSWNNDHVAAAGATKLPGAGRWVQADFPVMFTLDMTRGNRDALRDPSSLLISATFAEALFGNEDRPILERRFSIYVWFYHSTVGSGGPGAVWLSGDHLHPCSPHPR